MLLTGKVVLVTGGGRGIGAAICRVLAREGAAVAINYSASKDRAEAVAAKIRDAGGQAETFGADVRDAEATAGMITAAAERFGRLDGVVNNAIGGRQNGSLAEASPQDYQNAFAFGCEAVLNTVRAARPIMQGQGGGRVVNIVTELWNMAPAGWSVYMAGKGAMVGVSRVPGDGTGAGEHHGQHGRPRLDGRRESGHGLARIARLRGDNPPALARQCRRDRQRLRVLLERPRGLRHRRISTRDRRADHPGGNVGVNV